MTFKDVRFPTGISYGARGGGVWATQVSELESGQEQRVQAWSQPRYRFNVDHLLTAEQLKDLVSMFHITNGMTHSFRFKDWGDYMVESGQGVFVLLAATTFQMYKRYTFGAYSFDRKITKPVSSTVVVTGGSGATVDYSTGIVTVSSGTPTSWIGQFDNHVRFDTDLSEISIEPNHYNWNGIELIEVR